MVKVSALKEDFPFNQQVMLADESVLMILSVKRYLPHRRLVCRALWRNKIVFAKLFFGKTAARYASRDKTGVEALSQALINTPNLIGEMDIISFQGIALIFRAIEPAKNAEEIYQTSNQVLRYTLMQQLVQTIGKHHDANLLQTDLHFKNFLMQQDNIYTLDGDGISALSWLFKKREMKHNLATLFSKMDVLEDRWIYTLYERYCSCIKLPYLLSDAKSIYKLTQKIRAKSSKQYADKKVFRNCTDVQVSQNFNEFKAFSSDFNAENLTEDQMDLALSSIENSLKSGNTCTVGKALVENQLVVIKRYNIKNFWHGFKLSISTSRAAKSWANAHRLTLLNIPTAKPLALIEKRFGWFNKRAFYLSQYIDAPDIDIFFAQNIDTSIKEKTAIATAQLFYKLYLLSISHGDCKASNIKVVDYKPVLIDLDSMQSHCVNGFFCNWWFKKKHVKDLIRLMQNWAKDAETSAIICRSFVQIYGEKNNRSHLQTLRQAKIA